jgi:hypothetical protein
MHIDAILFKEKLAARFRQNAIAPTTATLFLLTGILLLNSYKSNKLTKIINDTILLVSYLLAYLGIIGYIYSLEPF